MLVLDDKGRMDADFFKVIVVTLYSHTVTISFRLSSREWVGVCVYARFYA